MALKNRFRNAFERALFQLKQILFCASLTALLAFQATGQSVPVNPAEEEPQVLLSVDVGYNTAYRDGSWVPIDVTVVNEQDDIEGWVEVQTFDVSGERQSPVYRVPADCPQYSDKKFRILAWLSGTERVDAWVYEGDRPAVDVPAYVQIQPIASDDLLVLVLDSDAANLGFLFEAVQRAGRNVRLHRHTLLAEELAQLPEHQAAYDVFDAIILNETEPERIGPERRALLQRYVETGGTLIVHTGLHAGRVEGTWLDGLTGVEIGETLMNTEGDLAPAVFGSDATGRVASASHDGMMAELREGEGADGALWFGEDEVLVVKQPRGDGRVYTLAVDASTNLLKDHPTYQALWRQMLSHRTISDEGALRFDSMAQSAAEILPRLSGVTIRPVGFIAAYLALYIVVAITLNWLFWSWRKRRELAWLTLAFASVGFCAFAIVYGSAGWAESSELHRIGVVEYGETEGAPARYTELAGVLTARTSTYRGPVKQQTALVRDGGARQLSQIIGRMAPSVQRPFMAVQGAEPWVENFRVGASEMRLARFENHLEAPGKLSARMYITDTQVRIEVENETGLPLQDAHLYHNGAIIPLAPDGTGWSMDLPEKRLAWLEQGNSERLNELNMLRYGFGAWPEGPHTHLRQAFLTSLVSIWSAGSGYMDPAIDSRVFAWLDGSPYAAWQPEGLLTEQFGATLFVAPVIVGRDGPVDEMPITVIGLGNRNAAQRTEADASLWNNFSVTDPHPHFDLIAPPQCLQNEESVLRVEVLFMSLYPTDATIEVVAEKNIGSELRSLEQFRESEETITIQGQEVTKRTYAIPDAEIIFDPASRTGRIKLEGQRSNMQMAVAAACTLGEGPIESGEWHPWPSLRPAD